MRVIAGSSRGQRLSVPKALTRPTSDRVREALFSMLGTAVEEAKVLDLYAGSGALGIEALSRGASRVDFVDRDGHSCGVIEKNLTRTGLGSQARVHRGEVARFLKGVGSTAYDLVFADPPYARDEACAAELAALLTEEGLRRAVGETGIFILESYARQALPPIPDVWTWDVLRDRSYGDTRLTLFMVTESETDEGGEG